jgi:choline dehydrogenase-like flavoprotein
MGNPCGYLIPKYANTEGHRNKNFLRGYRFDGASQQLHAQAFALPGFGSAWRERVRREIPYFFAIEAQGECLPRYDNYVELDPEKKDAWGIPVLHIVASYEENERAMSRTMREDIGAILDALKLANTIPPAEELSVFGKNIHEGGTARMGHDPKKSVLNAYNQVHEVNNVFVTDGAAFVTQGCYEPTLTIMAISARAADYMIDAHKKGEV